jgi:hypothetical protein
MEEAIYAGVQIHGIPASWTYSASSQVPAASFFLTSLETTIMQRLIAAALFALFALPSYAQTPQKVVPGYQTCSNASGTTVCSFIPADLTHGLPVNVVAGGSGGGGGGGAVTNAGTFAVQLTGATNNINNVAGTISLPTGAATAALQSTINTTLGTPFQAGGSIGNTTFAVTNAGTFAVQNNAATPAGTNLMGKVGIDQTTPGTTNGVQVNAALPAGTNVIGTVGQSSQYPVGATAITASATGTTAATTATLAGTSGKTTYICGYSIRANATANTNVTNTITGVITATLSSIMWVPANTVGLGVDEQIFSPCIPASTTNTGIAIVSGAPGTGGLVSSKGWGYQL